MNDQYLNKLYNYISENDPSFKNDVTPDAFVQKMSNDDYVRKMHSWISSIDPTFNQDLPIDAFIDKVKKKDEAVPPSGQSNAMVSPSEGGSSVSQQDKWSPDWATLKRTDNAAQYTNAPSATTTGAAITPTQQATPQQQYDDNAVAVERLKAKAVQHEEPVAVQPVKKEPSLIAPEIIPSKRDALEPAKAEMPKVMGMYNRYQAKIETEKQLEDTKSYLNTQLAILRDDQIKYIKDKKAIEDEVASLNSIPESERNSPEYIQRAKQLAASAEDLDNRMKSISDRTKQSEQDQSDLQSSIGKYTAGKFERTGILFGEESAVGQHLVRGMRTTASGFVDLISNAIRLNPLVSLDAIASKQEVDQSRKEAATKMGWDPLSTSYEDFVSKLDDDKKSELESKAKDLWFSKGRVESQEIVRGAPVSTAEWEQAQKGAYGAFAKAATIAADIAPTMVAGAAGAHPLMFAQMLDGIDEQIDKSPEFEGISENEKLLAKVPTALVGSYLIGKGLSKMAGSEGVINTFAARALSKVGANVTGKELGQIIANDVNSALAHGVLKFTSAGAAAFEGGFAADLATTTAKDVYNLAKGKKMFQTPDSLLGTIKQAAEVGADMALGGAVLGMPHVISDAYTKSAFNSLDNYTIDLFKNFRNDTNVESAIATDLSAKVFTGRMTADEAKLVLSNYRDAAGLLNSIPEDFNNNQIKTAMRLMREKAGLEQYISGKDAALVKTEKDRISEINSELEKIKQNAIQEPSTEGGMLRPEGPQVELPKVGEGDAEGQAAPQEAVEVKKEVDHPLYSPETTTLSLEEVPVEDKMKVEFTQDDGTVTPINGNEKMASDLYHKAIAVPEADRTESQRSVINAVESTLKDHIAAAEFERILKPVTTMGTKPIEMTETTLDANVPDGFNDVQKKVLGDVKNVIGVINNLVKAGQRALGVEEKGITVIAHPTEETYAEAAEKAAKSKVQSSGTKGFFFDTKTGEIHLNMPVVTSETLLHEAFHPVLDYMAEKRPEVINEMHAQLSKIKGADVFTNKAKRAYKGETTIKKEAITDFIAHVADGKFTINRTNFQAVRDFVVAILEKLGIRAPKTIETVKDLRDLAKLMTKKFAKGEDVLLKKQGVVRKMLGKEKAQFSVKDEERDLINGFYSALDEIIASSKQDKMPAKQWLDKFGRSEEAKWTGLKDWLSQQQGSLSKDDVRKFLKDNRVSVEIKDLSESNQDKADAAKKELEKLGYTLEPDMTGEEYDILRSSDGKIIEYGEAPDNVRSLLDDFALANERSKDLKYAQYQEPGEKSNYKEVLITLPVKEPVTTNRDASEYSIKTENESQFTGQRDVIILKNGVESGRRYGTRATDEEIINDHISKLDAEDLKQKRKDNIKFKSSHFDEPDILAHLRMNTRTDANGNKVLFLEEVQSDWGQKGKKEGFENIEGQKLAAEKQGLLNQYDDLDDLRGKDITLEVTAKKRNILDKIKSINKLLGLNDNDFRTIPTFRESISPAPFVTDTNAWTKLALKVALQEAVKQGADRIAWTTGEQQFGRWGSERIDWKKNEDGTWQVAHKTQEGGTHEGQDLEQIARERGLLIEDKGKKVSTKEDLEKIVESATSSSDMSADQRKKLTDRVWNRMQTEGEGTSMPRREGMKGFYGQPSEGEIGFIGKIAKSLTGQEPEVVRIGGEEYSLGEGNYVGSTGVYDSKGDLVESFNTQDQAQKFITDNNSPAQHSIAITPEIRAQVEAGLPQFQAKDIDSIVEQARAQGLSDQATRIVLKRQGFTPEQIDEALKGTTAAKRIELSEATLPGYERLQDKLAETISKLVGLKKSSKEIVDAVTKALERSDVYLKATDQQREELARKVSEMFEGKGVSAPSIEKLTGIGKKTAEEKTEAKMLSDQIESEAKAASEGAKSVTDAVKAIKDYFKKSKEKANLTRKDILKVVDIIATVKDQKTLDKAIKDIQEVIVNAKSDKIEISEMAALKNQIRFEARAAKDAKIAWSKASKALAKTLGDMVVKGKITLNQMSTIVNKFAHVNMLDSSSIDKFTAYMDKVISDVEYSKRIKYMKKNAKNALDNIKYKIGIAADLQPVLRQLFSINPDMIPDAHMSAYESLAKEFGERKTVLSVRERNEAIKTASEILDAVNQEQYAASDLKETYDNYADKVEKDGKISYSSTIDKMIEDGTIDANEAALMRKYKDIVNPKEPKEKLTEQELQAQEQEKKNDAISTLSEMKKAGIGLQKQNNQLPLRDERNAAAEMHNLVNDDRVLENMKADDLVKLIGVIGNINNGYYPHQAHILKEKMGAIKNGLPVSDNLISLAPRIVSHNIAKLKSLLTKRPSIQEMIRRNAGVSIDQLFGSFNNTHIADAVFRNPAKAHAAFMTSYTEVRNKLDEALSKMSNAVGKDPDETLMSKYKVMAYRLQREYEANEGSKFVAPAKEWIDATVKAKNTTYTDRDKKMLSSIKTGTAEEMYNTLTPSEKNFVKVLDDISKNNLFEKALYTQSVIRGNGSSMINDHVHHSVVSEGNTISDLSGISDIIAASLNMRPSTRAKSLTERTAGVKPLEFDAYSVANRHAKEILLDYHLTEAIRTSYRTLEFLKKEAEGYGKDKQEIIDAIDNAFKESVENVVAQNYMRSSAIDDVVDYLSQQGYRVMLAGTGRFGAEAASNLLFAAHMPKEFSEGLKERQFVYGNDLVHFMQNVGASETHRVAPHNTLLASKLIDPTIITQDVGTKESRAVGAVKSKLDMIYNNSVKRYKNSVEAVADALIGTPDKAVIKPIWYGSFVTEFEKITGQKPNKDKILSNDEQYMRDNEDAIKRATAMADKKAQFVGASDNPFEGILRGADKHNQKTYTRMYHVVNNFMSKFNIFEFTTARTALMAAMGKGYLSRKEGVALLSAVTARQAAYMLAMRYIGGGLVGAAYSAITGDDDKEDDKNTFKQNVVQSVAAAGTNMMLGTSGNWIRNIASYGVEKLNEDYFDFMRTGKYDPYKDNISNTSIPHGDNVTDKDIINTAAGFFGPLSPTMKTAALVLKRATEKEKKTPEAIKRSENDKYIRIPMEILGNTGYIPAYKDVRKVMIKEMYKGIDKATQPKGKVGGLTKEEMKIYMPDLYRQIQAAENENKDAKIVKQRYENEKKKLRKEILRQSFK